MGAVVIGQLGTRDQPAGGGGDVAKLCSLPLELQKVRITVGVEQSQPREMPGVPELLGRCRQQQQPGRAPAQGTDQLVLRTRHLRGPAQMVRLIDNHNVPARLDRELPVPFTAGEKGDTAKDQLLIEKGIPARRPVDDRGAARLVVNAEPHVESAIELEKPLVDERVRHQDKHARRQAVEVQAMDNQPGLDGLAEPDLISQQDSRDRPIGDFVGDVDLMRDQADTAADQAADWRLPAAAAPTQRLDAQVEQQRLIDVAVLQPVQRLVEGDTIGQCGFRDPCRTGDISDQTGIIDDLVDGDLGIVPCRHRVAGGKDHPPHRRGLHGVPPHFLAGAELNADIAVTGIGDDTEPELRFRFTHPALANDEHE